MQGESGAVDDASVVIKDIKELKPTSFRCLERFLLEKYAPFLFNHAAKVVVLSFLFVAIALVFATKLPTATKNPSLFPAWHNQKKNDYIQSNLVTAIAPTPFPIDIIWGLEEVDGANTNDPESESNIQAVFDTGFDASSVAAQNHFVWLCSSLLGEMDILRSMKSCWILGFQNYCKLNGIDFPVATPALFRETISQYYHDERPTDILVTTAAQDALIAAGASMAGGCVDDDPSCGEWAGDNECNVKAHKAYMQQNCKKSCGICKSVQPASTQSKGLVTLRSVRVTFYGQAYVTDDFRMLKVFWGKVEAWVKAANAEAVTNKAAGVARSFQTSRIWRLTFTIINLQSSFQLSALVSILLAFVFLIISTTNIVVAFYAILCLIGTALSVLALMFWGGFQIGVLESICLSLLIGLSVDYVAHMANAYVEAPLYGRGGAKLSYQERVAHAIVHMGISVMSGAASTAVSGLMLFFTTIYFFTLFGYFIVTCTILSLLFAMCLFPAMLFLFGTPDWADLRRWCKGKGKANVTDTCSSSSTNGGASKGASEGVSKGVSGTGEEHASLFGDYLSLPQHADDGDSGGMESAKKRKQMFVRVASAVSCLVMVVIAVISAGETSPTVGLTRPTPSEGLVVTKEQCAVKDNKLALHMKFPETNSLNGQKTEYKCSGFTLDSQCTTWANKIEVINQNPAQVHHIILFSTTFPQKSCPSTCFDMPDLQGLLYSWAVGTSGFVFPDGVGLPLGGSSTNVQTALQIHYSNYAGVKVKDRSGLKIHVSTTKPKNEAGVIVGSGFAIKNSRIRIPGGVKNTTYTATCSPKLTGPVTTFAYAMHAHIYGVQIRSEVLRGGKGNNWEWFGEENPYDFNYQRFTSWSDAAGTGKLAALPSGSPSGTDPTVLNPGDTIRVHCSYDTSKVDKNTFVTSGFASDEEMCMAFYFVYPIQNVESTFCFDYSSAEEARNAGGHSQGHTPTAKGTCVAGTTFSASGNEPCTTCAADATCTAGVNTACVATANTVCNPSTPFNHSIPWTKGFSGKAEDQTMPVKSGEVLKFVWTGGHNVFLMKDKAAFDACDFSGGTNLGGASPVYHTMGAATTYFACKVGAHCLNGQKLSAVITT